MPVHYHELVLETVCVRFDGTNLGWLVKRVRERASIYTTTAYVSMVRVAPSSHGSLLESSFAEYFGAQLVADSIWRWLYTLWTFESTYFMIPVS